MPRWEGGSRQRLQNAALDLFEEVGYAATTTTDIANRAGVTERTLHRLFGDKREILFSDGHRIKDLLVASLPEEVEPAQSAAIAYRVLAADLQARPHQAARRAVIVARTPELLERELLKVRTWSAAIAQQFVSRGEDILAANVHAEVATAIFRAAYTAWVTSDLNTELTTFLAQAEQISYE